MRRVVSLLLGVAVALGSDENYRESQATIRAARRVITRPLRYGLQVANPDREDWDDIKNGAEPRIVRQPGRHAAAVNEDDEEEPVLAQNDNILPEEEDNHNHEEIEYRRRPQRRARKHQEEDELGELNNEQQQQQPVDEVQPQKQRPRRSRSFREGLAAAGITSLSHQPPASRRQAAKAPAKIEMFPIDMNDDELDEAEKAPAEVQPTTPVDHPLNKNAIDWSQKIGPIGAAGAGIMVVLGLATCCVRGRKKSMLPLTTQDAFGGRHMAAKRA